MGLVLIGACVTRLKPIGKLAPQCKHTPKLKYPRFASWIRSFSVGGRGKTVVFHGHVVLVARGRSEIEYPVPTNDHQSYRWALSIA